MELGLPLNIYVISLAAVAAINYFTYLVMARGVGKQNKAGMVYLLGGIGLKFLLYLAFITLVWAITKNLSKGFIITFFALYLFFTFLLAGNLFKILKNK
jgi:hypothetical protein